MRIIVQCKFTVILIADNIGELSLAVIGSLVNSNLHFYSLINKDLKRKASALRNSILVHTF